MKTVSAFHPILTCQLEKGKTRKWKKKKTCHVLVQKRMMKNIACKSLPSYPTIRALIAKSMVQPIQNHKQYNVTEPLQKEPSNNERIDHWKKQAVRKAMESPAQAQTNIMSEKSHVSMCIIDISDDPISSNYSTGVDTSNTPEMYYSSQINSSDMLRNVQDMNNSTTPGLSVSIQKEMSGRHVSIKYASPDTRSSTNGSHNDNKFIKSSSVTVDVVQKHKTTTLNEATTKMNICPSNLREATFQTNVIYVDDSREEDVQYVKTTMATDTHNTTSHIDIQQGKSGMTLDLLQSKKLVYSDKTIPSQHKPLKVNSDSILHPYKVARSSYCAAITDDTSPGIREDGGASVLCDYISAHVISQEDSRVVISQTCIPTAQRQVPASVLSVLKETTDDALPSQKHVTDEALSTNRHVTDNELPTNRKAKDNVVSPQIEAIDEELLIKSTASCENTPSKVVSYETNSSTTYHTEDTNQEICHPSMTKRTTSSLVSNRDVPSYNQTQVNHNNDTANSHVPERLSHDELWKMLEIRTNAETVFTVGTCVESVGIMASAVTSVTSGEISSTVETSEESKEIDSNVETCVESREITSTTKTSVESVEIASTASNAAIQNLGVEIEMVLSDNDETSTDISESRTSMVQKDGITDPIQQEDIVFEEFDLVKDNVKYNRAITVEDIEDHVVEVAEYDTRDDETDDNVDNDELYMQLKQVSVPLPRLNTIPVKTCRLVLERIEDIVDINQVTADGTVMVNEMDLDLSTVTGRSAQEVRYRKDVPLKKEAGAVSVRHVINDSHFESEDKRDYNYKVPPTAQITADTITGVEANGSIRLQSDSSKEKPKKMPSNKVKHNRVQKCKKRKNTR